MMKEFSTQDIANMITWWHRKDLIVATSFSHFWIRRYDAYKAIQKKDYGWD